MTANTADAIAQASERSLTRAEVDAVEERVETAMRDLARMSPETWGRMSPEERAKAAGELAQARYVDALMAKQRETVRAMHAQVARRHA